MSMERAYRVRCSLAVAKSESDAEKLSENVGNIVTVCFDYGYIEGSLHEVYNAVHDEAYFEVVGVRAMAAFTARDVIGLEERPDRTIINIWVR